MTQQTLADAVGCHVTMIRCYEANETQPTLEVIRNMARALSVSADALIFEQDERGPSEELLLQFEAVSQLLPAEQAVVKDVLESLNYQVPDPPLGRRSAVRRSTGEKDSCRTAQEGRAGQACHACGASMSTPLQPLIQSRILALREQRVMLDADLAQLYGVETRVLVQTSSGGNQ